MLSSNRLPSDDYETAERKRSFRRDETRAFICHRDQGLANGFYPHRAPGSHRHHRDFGGAAVAGADAGQNESASHKMQKSASAVRAWSEYVHRGFREIPVSP